MPVGEGGILLAGLPESALFQVSKSAEGYTVEETWRSRVLRRSLAVPVSHEGYLYGYAGSFLTCVDAATGEMVWKSRPPGSGNLLLIDGHLVILNRDGEDRDRRGDARRVPGGNAGSGAGAWLLHAAELCWQHGLRAKPRRHRSDRYHSCALGEIDRYRAGG